MSQKDTGGPAFAHSGSGPVLSGGIRYEGQPPYPGMSLRDYFAGQALVMVSEMFNQPYVDANERYVVVARKAYEVADAMLAERIKP